MKNWPTQFDNPGDYITNPGNPIKDTFALFTDEKGNTELRKKGEIDLSAEINSHADSVNIHTIINRYMNGDTSVLTQKQGIFTDLTVMPQSFSELYQKVCDAEEYFKSLPLEIRSEYGFNPAAFYSDIGTEHFNSIFNKSDAVVEEVTEKGDEA